MKNSKVLETLLAKPRNQTLQILFKDLPLLGIFELIKISNVKIALLDDNIRDNWVQLFDQRNKKEILNIFKKAIKKEQSKIIQLPSDDEPDEIDIDISMLCFCPCCNNMVTKKEYGEIDCPYCN